MTLSITDAFIDSDITDHHAALITREGEWACSWTEDRKLTRAQAIAAMELAEIVARGRDDKDTTNYSYLTWQRVKELADILGVIPLKTVLDLEGLEKR